ncbi:MAG: biotin--[acetyl-CoA-carboxylase] ligase [Flavobacteriales bacterium]|nr:biotin--[acetyl-CoA-carboxylase] ligase [Flavobacteriales bacterium]
MYNKLFIGNQIVALEEISSTNDYLMQLVKSGRTKGEGLVVTAENQTAGKGQRGSSWESEPGKNIMLSVLLATKIPADRQFVISKMVSLAIADCLESFGIPNVQIKWPNDIYCGKKKMAGILIENLIREQSLSHTIVGIGLNVNQVDFGELGGRATSLAIESGGAHFDPKDVLDRLLGHLDRYYVKFKTRHAFTLFDADYTSKLYGWNVVLPFNINGHAKQAVIRGVDPDGKLCLEFNDERQVFDLKEVEFLF